MTICHLLANEVADHRGCHERATPLRGQTGRGQSRACRLPAVPDVRARPAGAEPGSPLRALNAAYTSRRICARTASYSCGVIEPRNRASSTSPRRAAVPRCPRAEIAVRGQDVQLLGAVTHRRACCTPAWSDTAQHGAPDVFASPTVRTAFAQLGSMCYYMSMNSKPAHHDRHRGSADHRRPSPNDP
jgi:hypothetical protein